MGFENSCKEVKDHVITIEISSENEKNNLLRYTNILTTELKN